MADKPISLWQRITQALGTGGASSVSANDVIRVRVDDANGKRSTYGFTRPIAEGGLSVGSDARCHVRIAGAGIRSAHARLQWMGYHWVLKFCPPGQQLPLPREFEGDYDQRVDRVEFRIEGNRLQISDA